MYSNVPRSPNSVTATEKVNQDRKIALKSTPGTAQCGVAPAIANRKKPMSHMLKIIGGRVVRRGSYPWQVAILNRFKVR